MTRSLPAISGSSPARSRLGAGTWVLHAACVRPSRRRIGARCARCHDGGAPLHASCETTTRVGTRARSKLRAARVSYCRRAPSYPHWERRVLDDETTDTLCSGLQRRPLARPVLPPLERRAGREPRSRGLLTCSRRTPARSLPDTSGHPLDVHEVGTRRAEGHWAVDRRVRPSDTRFRASVRRPRDRTPRRVRPWRRSRCLPSVRK